MDLFGEFLWESNQPWGACSSTLAASAQTRASFPQPHGSHWSSLGGWGPSGFKVQTLSCAAARNAPKDFWVVLGAKFRPVKPQQLPSRFGRAFKLVGEGGCPLACLTGDRREEQLLDRPNPWGGDATTFNSPPPLVNLPVFSDEVWSVSQLVRGGGVINWGGEYKLEGDKSRNWTQTPQMTTTPPPNLAFSIMVGRIRIAQNHFFGEFCSRKNCPQRFFHISSRGEGRWLYVVFWLVGQRGFFFII